MFYNTVFYYEYQLYKKNISSKIFSKLIYRLNDMKEKKSRNTIRLKKVFQDIVETTYEKVMGNLSARLFKL